MARADSTSTTRRTFVRLAAAAALPTIHIPAAGADAELVGLGQQLAELSGRVDAENDHALVDKLCREGEAIIDQMHQLTATTVAGAQAKCVALLWMHGHDGEHWDCPYLFALVEDVLALNAAGV